MRIHVKLYTKMEVIFMTESISNLGQFIKRAMKKQDINLSELSYGTHQSKQAISGYATDRRPTPFEKLIGITKHLKDAPLSYKAAEQAFGILNLRRSDDLSHDDPFAISFVRDKEERERQAIEPIVFAAMLVPYSKRSAVQHEEVQHGIKEMAEEISSELLYFSKVCDEEHVNTLEMIKKVNQLNAKG